MSETAVMVNVEEYHAERVNGAWQQTVDGALEVARRLLEARQEIEHGAWLPFVQERLVFGERTAQMLLGIAESPRFGNTNHGAYLPPSWRTLYELATLNEQDWKVVEPHISPEMERKDIKKLLPHVSRNSGENEWYTPPDYIQAARDFMGAIDLDPATSEIANRTVGAAQIFTEEENGLLHPWHGRVWMNPPYASELVGRFAEKLCHHVDEGDVTHAAVLVNNATETRWFQDMARRSHSICFPLRRVRFLDPQGRPGAPLQGQAVLGIGGEPGDFLYAFQGFGLCVRVHPAAVVPPDE